ncbi:MAG: ATP-binding protein [Marmoricola sp.]
MTRARTPAALSGTSIAGGLAAEVARLQGQLEQEQSRRFDAETVGERATADLIDIVRQLRETQSQLIDSAAQSRLVSDLTRALRQDLDTPNLVARAAELMGHTLLLDRCQVVVFESDAGPGHRGIWAADTQPRPLGDPCHMDSLVGRVENPLIAGSRHAEAVRIDRVAEDDRLAGAGAGAGAELAERSGVHALAFVPATIGRELVGCILLESSAPRHWRTREMVICESLTRDLVASLVQAQAFEQQRRSMLQLEELDRTKDAFISSVSHELRTPLTSIVGYLELMADGGMGELSEELAHGIEIIERNAVRLRAVVEDLLTLSAYDAGAVVLAHEPVDLSALVAECHHSLFPSASARGITIEVELNAHRPRPMGDEEQLHRVVLNLINNAIKFSRDASQVSVRLDVQDAHAVLVVADQGIGIPQSEVSQVFSRFFRSTLAVRDEIQGTGLGLALAKTVVDRHRGSLELQSEEGVGTVVTLRLPLED